ncbi:MAG: hypothetical protein ACRD2Z_07800 [Thermoanaerobaculia bacterium]
MRLGAQALAMPTVPWAQAITGRGPERVDCGTATTPLARAGTPLCNVEVYRMRHAVTPSGSSPLYGSERNSTPGSDGTVAGGE